MLSIQNLTTGYGKKRVLDNVSLDISEGEFVLLTGGNGSGKSTLLKAIYGLLKPWKNEDGSTGKIIYNNKDITNTATSNLLAQGMAYMQQKKNVFEDFTIEENLITAASIYSKEETQNKIRYIYETIPKLSTLKKRTPFSMSGGEKQLLAFSCVLLHAPNLILLDEPLAGVDEFHRNILASLIYDSHKSGVTIIIVEHDISFYNKYDFNKRTICLQK